MVSSFLNLESTSSFIYNRKRGDPPSPSNADILKFHIQSSQLLLRQATTAVFPPCYRHRPEIIGTGLAWFFLSRLNRVQFPAPPQLNSGEGREKFIHLPPSQVREHVKSDTAIPTASPRVLVGFSNVVNIRAASA